MPSHGPIRQNSLSALPPTESVWPWISRSISGELLRYDLTLTPWSGGFGSLLYPLVLFRRFAWPFKRNFRIHFNRWNEYGNDILFTLLYRGIMHLIPSQWAHECALYRIGSHIGCLSVDYMGRLSVPIFILQYWKQFYCAHRLGDVHSCSPLHWICKV